MYTDLETDDAALLLGAGCWVREMRRGVAVGGRCRGWGSLSSQRLATTSEGGRNRATDALRYYIGLLEGASDQVLHCELLDAV